jgi:iron complex outermembrane receptor protein
MTEDLLLRATMSEGFRAPSIGELFGSASRFDATLNDPCSDFNNSGASQQTIDNCIALGVPANGSYVQANPQISVTTGGNAALNPEFSDSFTAGAVWNAGFAEGMFGTQRLEFELTYYKHELDGAIQAIDAQTQLDQCVAAGGGTICNGITRNVNGAIVGFENRLLNIGGIETSGWDFNVTWRGDETGWGRFGFDWQNAFVDEYVETSPTGSIDLAGIERNDSGIPEWTSTLAVSWQKAEWTGAWNLRMIGELTETCSDFLDGTANSLTALGLCSNPDTVNNANSTNRLGTTVYHDVQLSYDVDLIGQTTITFGINNVFDKNPPICVSCSLNGYDASNYEIPGRFPYLRLIARFE